MAFLRVVLALFLLLGLAACGDEADLQLHGDSGAEEVTTVESGLSLGRRCAFPVTQAKARSCLGGVCSSRTVYANNEVFTIYMWEDLKISGTYNGSVMFLILSLSGGAYAYLFLDDLQPPADEYIQPNVSTFIGYWSNTEREYTLTIQTTNPSTYLTTRKYVVSQIRWIYGGQTCEQVGGFDP